jgi:hypothetical protein
MKMWRVTVTSPSEGLTAMVYVLAESAEEAEKVAAKKYAEHKRQATSVLNFKANYAVDYVVWTYLGNHLADGESQ